MTCINCDSNFAPCDHCGKRFPVAMLYEYYDKQGDRWLDLCSKCLAGFELQGEADYSNFQLDMRQENMT